MPCYNAAGTLDEAMVSLLEQSLSDFEIIAVDDGSTDGTSDRLGVWAGRDPRVRVLRIKHCGIIGALNAGLTRCQAPLIARMDADDRAHPQRLELQASFLDRHPDTTAVGCLVEAFPPGQVREGYKQYVDWLNSLVTPEQIAREIYIESPLAHPSMVIRRRWLDKVGGYQERSWPEDYDLWLRMHLAGASFAKVERVLFYWREHAPRLTRTDSRYSVENFLRAKAHYLVRGPTDGADAVILWGAGQMGRRISKHLVREGAPVAAFLDIDPKKIGRQLRGIPILAVDDLPELWRRFDHPILLAAVGSRGARRLIRERLRSMGFREGSDWWAVA